LFFKKQILYESTCDEFKKNLDKIRKETDFIEVINFSLLFYVKKNILDSLNQNERLKFLEIKSLEIIFPEMKQLLNEKNQDRLKMSQFFICFDLFFHIFTYLKNDFSNKEFDSSWYDNYSKEWLKVFLGINEKNKITPYIHSFIHHIPDFIRKFKNLNKFSTQSLEKLQSLTKKNFLNLIK